MNYSGKRVIDRALRAMLLRVALEPPLGLAPRRERSSGASRERTLRPESRDPSLRDIQF